MAGVGNIMPHPVLTALQATGCKSRSMISLALKVYMDLSEVKAMWEPQYNYNSELDLIYIVGKWSKNDSIQDVVVPLSASATVSPAWLTEIQNEICPGEERKTLTLAIVAGDSSISYYQVSNGLEPPDSPETVRRRKCKEERQQCKTADMMRKASEIISDIIESDSVQESENDNTPND